MLHAPRTTPHDYGFKSGDYHLIVNAETKTATMYNSLGNKLWTKPCLATGQDPRWWVRGGDTPPGVYYLGEFHNDLENGTMEAPFGWSFFDMVDLEGREDGNGRSGVGLHGGGSPSPNPFAEDQGLYPTHGCVRMLNKDLLLVAECYNQGRVYVSVYQDDI
jgi:hypothetical protein